MEFSIRRVSALFKKEIKDVGKNKNVLLMGMLPILYSILYSKLNIGSELGGNVGKTDILIMCLDLSLVMVAFFVIALLIAEEKEKNTLRTLMLSAVTPWEFLAGKVLITFFMSEIINVAMFFIVGIDAKYLGIYILLTTLVIFSIIELGALVGIIAPDQMSTGVIGMPVAMILLLIPMLAKSNETLTKIAEFMPNYNMDLMLEKVFKGETIGAESAYSIFIILGWILIIVIAFAYCYKKRALGK